MRSLNIVTTCALAAALGATALAAPGGKGGGKGGGKDPGEEPDPLETFDPEIAYREISKRDGQTLWLTNRDTSYQVQVANSQSPIVGFDLTSENSRVIAYDIAGTIYLRAWQTSPFALGEEEVLFPGSEEIHNLDFSRDDTKLAWVITTSGGPDAIYVHDFMTGQTALQPLTSYQVAHVRFSPDDDTLFFTGSDDPVSGHDGLYRYTLGSTIATKIIDRLPGNYYNTEFDVTRPSASGQSLLVMNDDQTPKLFTLSGQSVSMSFAGRGEKYTFNCDNSALLYLETGIRKGGLAITPIGGSIEVLEIPWDKHSDWMRRDPCD